VWRTCALETVTIVLGLVCSFMQLLFCDCIVALRCSTILCSDELGMSWMMGNLAMRGVATCEKAGSYYKTGKGRQRHPIK